MESKYKAQMKCLKNNYQRLTIQYKKEQLEEFKEICKKNNTTPTTEIKKFVNDYIERKEKGKMKFYDEEHEIFWNEKLKELQTKGKTDNYYKSIVYILSICPITREHFNDIFNIEDGEININSINAPYQTSTSEKTTRMAFSLWNRCNFDSEEDIEQNRNSEHYNVSEIFCCDYAPYFYEGIKIRYPEYTN